MGVLIDSKACDVSVGFFQGAQMKTIIILSYFFVLNSAFAGDFQWSGIYRLEGVQIENPGLDSEKKQESYGLQHLVLKPRIDAADGLVIRSRFDIFNSASYPNDQLGQIYGSGVGAASPTSGENSNVFSQHQKADQLTVSELYLTFVQEFGAFVGGRVPMQFGLGMVHNAGNGMFDHWLDNEDMVGYKIVMGNLYLLPMLGKTSENSITGYDDVNDFMIHFQYENPESGLEMGIFYQSRTAAGGNDQPMSGSDFLVGGPGATKGKHSSKNISMYGLKDTKENRFGMELSWQEGNYGVITADGTDVKMSGMGAALEYDFHKEASKYKFGVKAGYASGDDPNTADKFEGFIFDRNYDVAFMMFNHPLGQKNLLRTQLVGTENTDAGSFSHNSPDVEAISNVIYFSPHMAYQWSERWDLDFRLTTGFLQTDPIAGGNVDKALGYELDISFNFKPNDRISWVNELGLLFPGAAFKAGDANNFDNDFSYGISSKAAISF